MPVWFEVIALAIVAYGAGFGIGWGLWGRQADSVLYEDTE